MVATHYSDIHSVVDWLLNDIFADRRRKKRLCRLLFDCVTVVFLPSLLHYFLPALPVLFSPLPEMHSKLPLPVGLYSRTIGRSFFLKRQFPAPPYPWKCFLFRSNGTG